MNLSSSPNGALMTSVAVFLTSAFWYVRSSLKRRRKQRHSFAIVGEDDQCDGVQCHFETKIQQRSDSKEEDDDDCEQADYFGSGGHASGRVSCRGICCLTKIQTYQKAFFKCLTNPCISSSDQEGYIALCVAENKLVQEILANRLMSSETAITAFSDSSVYCYNGFLGLPSTRSAIAHFLAKRFLCVDQPSLQQQQLEVENTKRMIDPEHVAVGSGAGALLNNLFFTLAKPGDVVLIPAPYYAAFENNVRVVAGCTPYPVQLKNPVSGPTAEDLDTARKAVCRMGYQPKIVLLTNPNNPLGINYNSTVVANCIQWARSHNMHTVVDEVYALSQHYPVRSTFQSVIQILDNQMGHDVHHIWSLSKDFGACGFRFGVLYTQNNLLLQALANLNIFCGVSHPIQMVVAELLVDDDFLDFFLEESRLALVHSYRICTAKLEEMVVPYIPAEAGIFLYADFSSLLPQPATFEGEERFAALVQDFARVVMTPGASQRDRKPGMFRICYAWVSPDILEIAMERLSRLIMKLRKMHDWDDATFNADSLKDVLLCKKKGNSIMSVKRYSADLTQIVSE